jgi:hypothetical protein
MPLFRISHFVFPAKGLFWFCFFKLTTNEH